MRSNVDIYILLYIQAVHGFLEVHNLLYFIQEDIGGFLRIQPGLDMVVEFRNSSTRCIRVFELRLWSKMWSSSNTPPKGMAFRGVLSSSEVS